MRHETPARVTALLVAVNLSLRVFGLRATLRWLGPAREPNPAADHRQALELQALVDRCAPRRLLPATCLVKALVLHHLLRRRGAAAELHIGVQKPTAGGLLAHAWVSFDGVALGQAADVGAQYAPIFRA